jgi:hypothetical protein
MQIIDYEAILDELQTNLSNASKLSDTVQTNKLLDYIEDLTTKHTTILYENADLPF